MHYSKGITPLRAFTPVIAVAMLASGSPLLADTLTVTATGTIASSCGVSVQSAFPTGDLSTSGSSGAQALFNCNTPYRVRATSANGAMKNAAVAPAQFTNSLGYTLALSVPLDSGDSISATCAASALIAGQSSCALSPSSPNGLSSGSGTSTNKPATLTAQWTVQSAPRLLAGAYSDTITLTIAAQQ